MNSFLHRRFYKYLIQKFHSKPKLIKFIKANFVRDNRFCQGNIMLLRTTDIRPIGGKSLSAIAPKLSELSMNVYIYRRSTANEYTNEVR